MKKTREEFPKDPVSPSTQALDGLTGIPQSIQCPATQTDVEDEYVRERMTAAIERKIGV